MASFLEAVTKTLNYEKGLVDDPRDPGGLTNWGISQRAHPNLTPDEIRNMTPVVASSIYASEYWPALYSKIFDQVLAQQLFDFGVTSGIHTGVQTLQGCIFVRGGPAVDGVFGQVTLDLVNSRGRQLRVDFVTERLRFYAGLNKPEFLHSWFHRTIDGCLT